MTPTLQEMYFETETDMLSAINWLTNNQSSPDEYEIREQGLYPDTDYYYLKIFFAELDPLAIEYYEGVEEFIYDPWAEPPEDPEDPPEGRSAKK